MRVAMDYEAIPSSIDGLRECVTQIEQAVAAVEQAVRATNGEFDGETASAYYDAQAAWSQGVRQLKDYLNSMAEFVEMAAEGFRERETEHAETLA